MTEQRDQQTGGTVTDDDPLIGSTILDQYRVVRPIAKGGMGQVYLAKQLSMERYAAIKLLQVEPSSEHQERFRREARTLSKLTHPHIITVYNFGELADGRLFLAMEYAEGISLANLLAVGALPTAEAVEIARQCAEALVFAHGKEVIHRDFKPANVMLTHVSGRVHVKVLDFGIARAGESSCFTRDGALLGTPQYMSPEQCRGEPATGSSDQYALGLVFYEMLTGKAAITASTPFGFLQRHQIFTPPPPSLMMRAPHLVPLDAVVMRLQAKAVESRFPTMDEALEQLNQVAERMFPQQRARRSSSGLHAVTLENNGASRERSRTGPGLPSLSEGTCRVLVLGQHKGLLAGDWSALEHENELRVVARHRDLPSAQTFEDWDLCLLVLPDVCGDIFWSQSVRAGLRPHRTLVCINAPLESEHLRSLCQNFLHFLITPFPVEPDLLRQALGWLRHCCNGDGELLGAAAGVPVTQITTASQKDQALANLLEDARAERVRRPVARALEDLTDEMIMNAVFDAPVDEHGEKRYDCVDRASDVWLKSSEAVTVRWSIGDKQVAVAVRDQFGSITTDEILAHITGPPPAPNDDSSPGSGMGLRLMSRSAQHLVFSLSPGSWCEVLGLLDRNAAPATARSRSLTVLRGLGQLEMRIGKRLSLFESKQQGGVRLRLEGEIDETCDLGAVFRREGTVWLDLSGVARINSVGIRKWLEAARTAPAELMLQFERCAPPIVSQMNMIPTFISAGRVESILAPYMCPGCGEELLELIKVTDPEMDLPPRRRCPACKEPLEFDDLPDEYFAFLER